VARPCCAWRARVTPYPFGAVLLRPAGPVQVITLTLTSLCPTSPLLSRDPLTGFAYHKQYSSRRQYPRMIDPVFQRGDVGVRLFQKDLNESAIGLRPDWATTGPDPSLCGSRVRCLESTSRVNTATQSVVRVLHFALYSATRAITSWSDST
jgi:hypothetical protein